MIRLLYTLYITIAPVTSICVPQRPMYMYQCNLKGNNTLTVQKNVKVTKAAEMSGAGVRKLAEQLILGKKVSVKLHFI